ncbi:MAG: sugar ABC transporter permease [Clostridiales bacterium]|nr:sugar ABC transporter permease [Clostridiales bacterium]
MMRQLLSFGIGEKKIMAQGRSCAGAVTQVSPCYWLKVNTKPIRAHAWDGAVYPHMVSFQYEVNGCAYTGKRYYSWTIRPPVKGSRITVYYDEKDPSRYAVLPK